MKNIILIALVATAFWGCSKSGTVTTSSSATLVGKWHIVEDSLNFYFTDASKNSHGTDLYDNSYFIQFNADGTGNNSNQYNFTYKVIDNQKITFYDQAYTSGGYNYPADTATATIQLLANGKLHLFFDFMVNEPGNDLKEDNIYEYLVKE